MLCEVNRVIIQSDSVKFSSINLKKTVNVA